MEIFENCIAKAADKMATAKKKHILTYEFLFAFSLVYEIEHRKQFSLSVHLSLTFFRAFILFSTHSLCLSNAFFFCISVKRSISLKQMKKSL